MPSTWGPRAGGAEEPRPGHSREGDWTLRGGGLTCLEDPGRVLRDAGGLAEPTDVLTENSEKVFIAHDEVRHGTVGLAVVFVDIEPLLAGGQGGVEKSGTQTPEGPG